MKNKKAGKIYIVLYFAVNLLFLLPFIIVPAGKLGLYNMPLFHAGFSALLEENGALMAALFAATLAVFVLMILSIVTVLTEKSRFYIVPVIFLSIDIIFHIIFQHERPTAYFGLLYKIFGLVIYISLFIRSRKESKEKSNGQNARPFTDDQTAS